MPQPDELCIVIEGRTSTEKSHLVENLKDILLSLGYLVHPDPDHGFYTPAQLRLKPQNTPPIHIVEYDEEVEAEITQAEQAVRQ